MISPIILISLTYLVAQTFAVAQFKFDLSSVPQKYHSAMQQCSAIASKEWNSPIETRVKVKFSSNLNAFVLANAQSTKFVRYNNSYYTIAMAKRLHNVDLNRNDTDNLHYDMLLTFNTAQSWYGGSGKTPRDRYDLITVCLHEVAHGLFLITNNIAMTKNKNNTYDGRFQSTQLRRYDNFLACETNMGDCALASFRYNSSKFAQCITRGALWFRNNSTRVAQLYAPRIYRPGSSVFHLDPKYLSENRIIIPTIMKGIAHRSFGTIAKQIINTMLDQSEMGAPICSSEVMPVYPTVKPVPSPRERGRNESYNRDRFMAAFCATASLLSCAAFFLILLIIRNDK